MAYSIYSKAGTDEAISSALADSLPTAPADIGAATAAQGALADTAVQPEDLGTAATTPATDYATAAQGAKADASDVDQITLTGNLALTIPEGHPARQVYRCAITQTTGGHTVTYDGQPVAVDTAAGAVTTVELHPAGAGYVVRYPSVADLSSLSSTYAPQEEPTFSTTVAADVTLGAELIDGTGWVLGAGWVGDFATGFVHTAGTTATLTRPTPTTVGARYLVTLTVASPTSSSAFSVALGGADPAYMYRGASALKTYTVGFKATASGDLIITPETTFDGTITAVSVTEVTVAATPAITVTDPTGATALEHRTGPSQSILLGYATGSYDATGDENTALGYYAMAENISGFWNTAVGWSALRSNINGSRNVAVGEKTLVSNTTGYRNVAVGQSVLVLNKTGQGNIAIGADAMLMNNAGNRNVAIGLSALGSNLAGSGNVAIGGYAMNGAEASENIGIGYYALYGSKGAGNTGVGQQAGRAITTGAQCTALGSSAMLYNATGADNTSVGFEAGRGKAPADANFNRVTTLGRAAGRRLNTGSDDNTAIGFTALGVGDGGIRNTAIGASAGASGVGHTINRNVLVGFQAGIYLQTGGDQNTVVGTSAGANLTTGHDNILIGYGANAPANSSASRLNIGDTIYGDLATDRIGVGVEAMTAVLHLKAGTATAGTAPLKLTAGTNLTTPEAGAIEFDGTNLYFTTTAGARKTLAVVE